MEYYQFELWRSFSGTLIHCTLRYYQRGIEAATRSMALDLAPWQIRVNAIIPGSTVVGNAIPVGQAATGVVQPADVIPLGRSAVPEDIAAAAAFLASDDASYITRQRLFVDGGMDAQLRSPAVDTQIYLGLVKRK